MVEAEAIPLQAETAVSQAAPTTTTTVATPVESSITEPTTTLETVPTETSVLGNAEVGSGADEVVLELSVFDWTESNPPGAVTIVIGDQTWNPDLGFGGDGRELGEFEVGVPNSFTVYPDGPGGRGIEIEFVMTEEMAAKSGSDEMMTHVEIHDSEVQAWGHAIPGFEAYYDR